MASRKTSISIDEKLLDDAESLAHDLKLSRSELFSLAIRDFIKARENKRFLEQLNNVYVEDSDEGEQFLLAHMKSHHARTAEQQW